MASSGGPTSPIKIRSITGKVGPKPFKLKLTDTGNNVYKLTCLNNPAFSLVLDLVHNTAVGNCAYTINQDHIPCAFNVEETTPTKKRIHSTKHIEVALTVTLFE